MKPKATPSGQFELFQSSLQQILNLDHELCQLAHAIDWDRFDTVLADCYSDEMGRPGNPESYSREASNLLELMDSWVLNKFDQATDCETSLEGDTVVYSYQRPKGIYRLILDAESHLPIEYVAPGYRYKYSYPKVVPVEIAKRFGFNSP